MMRLIGSVRLIPVVLCAIAALFVLKMLGLAFDGGYVFSRLSRDKAHPASEPMAASPAATPARARQSWAQAVLNYPDITGAVGGDKPDKAAEPAKSAPAPPSSESPPAARGGTVIQLDGPRLPSAGERAVLERLQERRQELEGRAREIEIREDLLKAAEKRIEARAAELKEIEARINAAINRKDESEAAKFKGLITMYENMKAKDAAKIFDRLDMAVLLDVSSQINPRRMSDILAQMSPETAERLTVALAGRRVAQEPAVPELPKIEGKRSGL